MHILTTLRNKKKHCSNLRSYPSGLLHILQFYDRTHKPVHSFRKKFQVFLLTNFNSWSQLKRQLSEKSDIVVEKCRKMFCTLASSMLTSSNLSLLHRSLTQLGALTSKMQKVSFDSKSIENLFQNERWTGSISTIFLMVKWIHAYHNRNALVWRAACSNITRFMTCRMFL